MSTFCPSNFWFPQMIFPCIAPFHSCLLRPVVGLGQRPILGHPLTARYIHQPLHKKKELRLHLLIQMLAFRILSSCASLSTIFSCSFPQFFLSVTVPTPSTSSPRIFLWTISMRLGRLSSVGSCPFFRASFSHPFHMALVSTPQGILWYLPQILKIQNRRKRKLVESTQRFSSKTGHPGHQPTGAGACGFYLRSGLKLRMYRATHANKI